MSGGTVSSPVALTAAPITAPITAPLRPGRLAGKVALITGGGAGIGAATARLFVAEGARVMLVDADAQSLARTLAAINGDDLGRADNELPERTVSADGRLGDGRLADCRLAVGRVADVADADAALAAVQQALQHFGRLDVLVNNAAMRNYTPLALASADEWQAMLNVNLLGAANYCRAALPLLRAAGLGSIVNVSSCYALTGRQGMGLYDATKAALLALTRTLAHEEAAHGIRANAVCPGATLTDFHLQRAAAAGHSIDQLKTQRDASSLLGRWAAPEEIAKPILWLASDEGSYITGTTLMVDGGLHVM